MQKNQSLYSAMLEGSRSVCASAAALYYLGKKISYGELIKKTDAFAGGLTRLGVCGRDKVTVALPNIPHAVYALYAISKLDAVAHLLHPLLSAQAVLEKADRVGSDIILVPDYRAAEFRGIAHNKTIVFCCPTDGFPITKIFYKLQKKPVAPDRTKRELDFSRLLSPCDCSPCRPSACHGSASQGSAKQTAVLLESGGTAGSPKTVELSALAVNSLCAAGLSLLCIDSVHRKQMLSVLPMFHGYGLSMGIHAMLCHGGANTLMPKFSAKKAVRLVKRGRVSCIIGIPKMYEKLMEQKGFSGKALQRLHVAFVGGDFVNPALLQGFNERMKNAGSSCLLLEGYGLTETSSVACVNTLLNHREGSVGRAVPGLSVRAFKDGAVTDGEGELAVCGDSVFTGYYNDEAATKAALINLNGCTWVRTGDIGRVDKDGYVYFCGREKRLIKVNGVNVFPLQIEKLACTLEGVNAACAVAVPHEKYGFVPRLYLVADRSVDGVLFDKIAKEISVFARPDKIVYLEEMPLTPLMKADVKALEQRAKN